MAARGVTLVRGEPGVSGYEVNRLWGDRQFLGSDLSECRFDALSEFALAGEHRNRAALVDADPGVELRIALQAAGQLLIRRLLGDSQSRRQRETHDQSATAEEKVTS